MLRIDRENPNFHRISFDIAPGGGKSSITNFDTSAWLERDSLLPSLNQFVTPADTADVRSALNADRLLTEDHLRTLPDKKLKTLVFILGRNLAAFNAFRPKGLADTTDIPRSDGLTLAFATKIYADLGDQPKDAKLGVVSELFGGYITQVMEGLGRSDEIEAKRGFRDRLVEQFKAKNNLLD